METGSNQGLEKAAFAAGCFWGVEARFRELEGVVDTAVGYMGGHTEDPTYEEVSTGRTGHAEAVLVEYDPGRISYDELLDAFWSMHDYTQLNRQGPDVGSQYRSVIFYYTEEQGEKALESRPGDAVTEIVPAPEFYRAEEYHQRYLEKKGW